MRYTFIASLLAAIGLAAGVAAHGQDHTPLAHHHPMAATLNDSRQLVHFPPEMRDHTLANMRDHVQVLSDILDAMAKVDYGKAGQIAQARLGMDSPSAQGCKPQSADAPPMSTAPDMEHQMAQFMPDGMRNIGLEMHQSASDFAAEAAKAGKTGNPRLALAALNRVTRQCVACHSSYKLH